MASAWRRATLRGANGYIDRWLTPAHDERQRINPRCSHAKNKHPISKAHSDEKLIIFTLGTLLFAGVTVSSHAQEAAPNGAQDPGHPRVNQVDSRERNQDPRITQGDRSGQLTNHETARLDQRENSIQRAKARDMRNDGGHLTRGEQRNLNRRQNRTSRAIARKKHNGRVR